MRDLILIGALLPLVVLAAMRPFVGVLVWSWISFMNPHRLTWSFAAEQPWAVMTFLATLIGCAVAREPRRLRINAVMLLMLVLMLGITMTSAMALAPPTEVWAKWDRTFKVLVGLLLTAALLDERRRVHALIWLMVISLGYFGVRGGVFTLTTGGGFIVMGPPDTMITDRNHLSVALLVSLPLMNYLRLQSRHRLIRAGLVAAMALTLFAVIGSQSRGALVALAATAAVLWFRSNGKLVSGIVIVAAVAAVITFMPDSWVERMNTLNTYQQDDSAMGRVLIWETALRLALMRPLFGGGFVATHYAEIVNIVTPGTTPRAAHSIWFEVLGEQGFPTFLVWLSIIVAGVVYSLRITRAAAGRAELRWAYDLARMSQVSIVAYVVGGTFLSLGYWDFFWTLIIVLGATHGIVVRSLADQAAPHAALPAAQAGAVPSWRGAAAGPVRAARGAVGGG